jgi:uncharacterized protein YcbX
MENQIPSFIPCVLQLILKTKPFHSPATDTAWSHFHLKEGKTAIESFLTGHFGIKTKFLQNDTGRFMDIPDISGATILSTASLQEVSTWFNQMNLDETRKRFRATLEIDGVPAFGKIIYSLMRTGRLNLQWAT